MLILDETETRAALPFDRLIDALDRAFRSGVEAPPRHHHGVPVPGEADATLLLMPAWQPGGHIGVKMVSVFPGNSSRGLPAIHGSYLLSSGRTGELLAVIDGGELTARRTAAASALAARHLARKDAAVHLMVGTGRLSDNLIEAHAVTRPIRTVLCWGRDRAKAESLATRARALGLDAEIVSDLAEAAGRADIISTATLSETPLIRGEWLKPGTHLDLVGAFKKTMRETDDAAVARASIFVDTFEGAFGEAGDLLQAIDSGAITAESLKADLASLCRRTHAGRRTDDEITLFKSVGTALEDLAGAVLALEETGRRAAGDI